MHSIWIHDEKNWHTMTSRKLLLVYVGQFSPESITERPNNNEHKLDLGQRKTFRLRKHSENFRWRSVFHSDGLTELKRWHNRISDENTMASIVVRIWNLLSQSSQNVIIKSVTLKLIKSSFNFLFICWLKFRFLIAGTMLIYHHKFSKCIRCVVVIWNRTWNKNICAHFNRNWSDSKQLACWTRWSLRLQSISFTLNQHTHA